MAVKIGSTICIILDSILFGSAHFYFRFRTRVCSKIIATKIISQFTKHICHILFMFRRGKNKSTQL